ncbi:MAG: hypothetical protein K2N63_11725, partial [Lachnospiraceae bacterium]|nr:hypothetical protein [Lachnospiraceae bacterium]
YLTYMSNGDMYQYILEHLSQPMELRYLKEILSIAPDYDNRMVTLYVRNVDAQSCEEILTYALEGILAKQPGIVEAVGEHELNSVNQAVYESVDLELDEWQKANIQYVSDLSIKLQEKGEEYEEWGRSPEPRKEYTTERIIKNSIKKFILGFLVGAVFAVIFIAFRYIMSDKLQDAKDLKNRFGLRVIAQMPKVHGRRVWVGIDRLFARMGGLAFYERDAAALARVAAQSVKAELTAMGIFSNEVGDSIQGNPMVQKEKRADDGEKATPLNKVRIAFTGNVAEEEISGLVSRMQWEESFAVQCVPSILSDPSAVSLVMEADYVVLVEKQEGSTYSKIGRELSELAAWKKNVLGFIVIGVDAIP